MDKSVPRNVPDRETFRGSQAEAAGNNRATGWSFSVTTTSSPGVSRWINSLKVVLASSIVTVGMLVAPLMFVVLDGSDSHVLFYQPLLPQQLAHQRAWWFSAIRGWRFAGRARWCRRSPD
jgi:hypothetical protein